MRPRPECEGESALAMITQLTSSRRASSLSMHLSSRSIGFVSLALVACACTRLFGFFSSVDFSAPPLLLRGFSLALFRCLILLLRGPPLLFMTLPYLACIRLSPDPLGSAWTCPDCLTLHRHDFLFCLLEFPPPPSLLPGRGFSLSTCRSVNLSLPSPLASSPRLDFTRFFLFSCRISGIRPL